MASKKELKNWNGIELTETLFDVMESSAELEGKFSAKQVVEHLQTKGKNYTEKQVIASLARLNTTCGLLVKHEPIKVTLYELANKEEEN